MIYVEILGRMGNQMFSYAFARHLQKELWRQRKEKIAFDFSRFSYLTPDWKNDLLNYKCSSNIVEKKRSYNFLQRIVLKLYFRNRSKLEIANEENIDNLENKWKNILNIFGIYLCSFNYYSFKFKPITKNVLVLGFYESPLFFEDIDSIIRDEFKPLSYDYSPEIERIINKIENCNSVCVGVRKGDFESAGNKSFCSVCGKNYYSRAILRMQEEVPSPYFIFFTDDNEWVNSNIEIPQDALVIDDVNLKLANYDKLYIMSKCKNFIISNSTFEWWAQHLSENSDKVVIAPAKWRDITPHTHTGIYEKSWIIVPTE